MMEHQESHAKQFLKLATEDQELRKTLESAIDDNLLTLAQIIGVERGLTFTKDQLQDALAEQLGLEELQDPDAGAGKCRSGCRTPCVYCNLTPLPIDEFPNTPFAD
jgi:hypothetical protein